MVKLKMKYFEKFFRVNIPVERNARKSSLEVTESFIFDESGYDVQIKATPAVSPDSKGNEVWLLAIASDNVAHGVDFERIAATTTLESRTLSDPDKPALLFPEGGSLDLRLSGDSVLEFLSHPWSGAVEIVYGGCSQRVNLCSPIGLTKRIKISEVVNKAECKSWVYTEEELEWLNKVREDKPKVIAVLNPDWRGVRSATENLVEICLPLQDDLTELSAERFAALLLQTGVENIFIGGFPITFSLLVEQLNKQNPDIHVSAFWLSSFMQSNEDYAWYSFQLMNRLCKEGNLRKIGFAKKGMAEAVAKTGVNAQFIPSCVRKVPDGPSESLPDGPHIGIWALAPIWRKNPYAMLAAVSVIEDAKVFVVGQEDRAAEFAEYFGLNVTLQKEPLPQDKMTEYLGRMDVNLYVTLSECSPMLPLESLAAGSPCLFGPNSHLFEDHPYLHSRLVVPYPDRSDVIAEKIVQALEERERIIMEYREYALTYNSYCHSVIQDYFDIDA